MNEQPEAPVIEAVAPGWLGWKIHLYVEGYQPGPKRRGVPRSTPLCGAFIHSNHRRVPLAEALKWPMRHEAPGYDPPLTRWHWCRGCVGHAVYLGGLLDEVLAMLVKAQVKTENVQGHLGLRA